MKEQVSIISSSTPVTPPTEPVAYKRHYLPPGRSYAALVAALLLARRDIAETDGYLRMTAWSTYAIGAANPRETLRRYVNHSPVYWGIFYVLNGRGIMLNLVVVSQTLSRGLLQSTCFVRTGQ